MSESSDTRGQSQMISFSCLMPNVAPVGGVAGALWGFDISGHTGKLAISIDMGAMGDFDDAQQASGGIDDIILFRTYIDGDPLSEQTVFEIRPAVGHAYTYRPFDDGDVFEINDPFEVRGDQFVVKAVVETNTTSSDTFLNKSPAHGAAAGLLDRFTTRIIGHGYRLGLRIEAQTDGIAKAFAFDNITIVSLPKGDFDGDGHYRCADVDALTTEIAQMTHNLSFDLTGDGVLNQLDLEAWLAEAGAANLPSGNPYSPADATLDGITDGEDFNVWNSHKFTSASTVPEPGIACLFLLSVPWFWMRYGRS